MAYLYTQKDILNTLRALWLTAQRSEQSDDWHDGFTAAIQAVAVAVGADVAERIEPVVVVSRAKLTGNGKDAS